MQNATQPTLKQQLEQKFTMPFWVWLLLYTAGISLGYTGGLLDKNHTLTNVIATAGFGLVCILVPLLVNLKRAHAKRKLAAPKFVVDNKAVSPVIGVILMVAITVVLAAIVFILVSHLSNNATTGAPPQISMQMDGTTQTTAQFTVISIENAPTWGELAFKDSNGATRAFTVNGAAAVSTAKVAAGDVLKFTGLTAATSYDLRAIAANAIVWTGHAQTIA